MNVLILNISHQRRRLKLVNPRIIRIVRYTFQNGPIKK